MMVRYRDGLAALAVAAAALVLAGCSAGPAGSATTPPTAPTSAVPTTAAPTATPTGAAEGAGCPANGGTVPSDADVATIEDVDGDGRADQEFYTEHGTSTSGFQYGIATASGAVITLDDDLAGPNRHSGWTSIRETGIATVLDDGRTATLHAFVDCAFVTTTDDAGKPYRFGLNGFSDYGTGVECSDQNGGAFVVGVLAAKQSDGTFTITGTIVNLVDEGRTATNGTSYEIGTGLAQDDPRVALAMTSTCGDVPKVGTSGR